MASNTIETIWKLVLSDKETKEGESTIQRLARLIKDKLGGESSKAIDKTTEAIKEQTEALKDNEKAAEDASSAGKGLGGGDAIGKIGGAAGKLRGVGSLVGGGEGLGIVNDIGDAVEGLQGLGSTIAEIGPVALVAAPALILLTAVVGDFAQAAQKTADEINSAIDNMRSVADEIAGGATSDDIQESIAQLQFRRDLEKDILAESTRSYEEFVQGIKDAFGIFAPLVEGILKIIDPREEALKKQIDTSNKLIQDSEAKERAYNKALEDGLTSKADAKQAEEERQKTNKEAEREAEKTAQEQKRAADKAASEREKAANDAQRAAEQQAAKEKQIEEKRYQAAQKYSDALIDISRKSADAAKKALQGLKDTVSDNTADFWQDIGDISTKFQEDEREEAIKRGEQEVQDAINQTRELEGIRDKALADEQDSLRKRDFLSATKIREAANSQMDESNQVYKDAQEDKLRAQRNEDAAQLRELDKARRERLQALDRSNAEARLSYSRALRDQKEADAIARREAKIAQNRELRAANELAQALLGIKQQQGQAELQMAQNTLNQLKGISNTTNNNNRTVNGGLHFTIPGGGAGGMSGTAITNHVLGVLGSVGLA